MSLCLRKLQIVKSIHEYVKSGLKSTHNSQSRLPLQK